MFHNITEKQKRSFNFFPESINYLFISSSFKQTRKLVWWAKLSVFSDGLEKLFFSGKYKKFFLGFRKIRLDDLGWSTIDYSNR